MICGQKGCGDLVIVMIQSEMIVIGVSRDCISRQCRDTARLRSTRRFEVTPRTPNVPARRPLCFNQMAPFCCRILGVINQNIMRVRFCRKSIGADRGAHIPGVAERTCWLLLYPRCRWYWSGVSAAVAGAVATAVADSRLVETVKPCGFCGLLRLGRRQTTAGLIPLIKQFYVLREERPIT